MADEVIAKHDSKRKGSKLGLGGITVIDAALVEFGRSRLPSIVGVAEWCYEAIAEWVEGSFRSSRNHIVIQQCPILLELTD
jgi:hypothetical protein